LRIVFLFITLFLLYDFFVNYDIYVDIFNKAFNLSDFNSKNINPVDNIKKPGSYYVKYAIAPIVGFFTFNAYLISDGFKY